MPESVGTCWYHETKHTRTHSAENWFHNSLYTEEVAGTPLELSEVQRMNMSHERNAGGDTMVFSPLPSIGIL